MGLDVTPAGLMREVDAWRSQTEGLRRRWERTVREYETRAASGDADPMQPENFKFRFTMHTTARNMSGKPYVRLESKNPIGEQRIADLTESGNAWICGTHYDEVRQRAIADQCLLDQSVIMVTQRPRPGFEQNDDPPRTPSASRIPPEMYMCDVYAQDKRSARIEGHAVIVDKDDLLRDAESDAEGGWDLDAIKRLTTDGPVSKYRPGQDQNIKRNEVVYWELIVYGHRLPDVDPDDKRYNGTVFCVAVDQEPVFIRAPRPHFGPRMGPYAITGMMVVPGKARYLSVLTAAEGRIQQYNAQSRANDIAAKNRKCMAAIDAMLAVAPEGQETPTHAILNGQDGDVLIIPGISQNPNAVQKIEVGGVTVEARTREMELKASIELELALSTAQQGQATGDATATENIIAARAGANAASLIDGAVENGDVEVVWRALWFLDNDYRSMVVRDGNVYLGGNTYEDKKKAIEHALMNAAIEPEQAKEALDSLEKAEGPMGTLEDLEVYVETVRADAAEEARITAANNFMLQWVPLLAQGAGQFSPGLQDFFNRVGRSLRVAEVGKVLDVPASVEAFQAAQEAANQPEARTASAPEPPRMVQAQQKPKPQPSPVKQAAKVGAA